ncbi:MAG: catechol 1,2-dioxygenase [Hyphomonadaceae bacterium]|nr:catechol 1,2-dioxygenase [Hyphomonadaceae bacterium]MBC6412068.1 catechol 1,2-dioxygenase [Hyphomonadaceae bacterium]
MSDNRLDHVVRSVVGAVREAVVEEQVTFEEYRAAIGYMMKIAEAGELPLFIDVFMNSTIVDVINRGSHPEASPSDMEGPYFVEGVPHVDGTIKTMDAYKDDEPLVVRGYVKDVSGTALPDVTLDIWSSTPDGKYGGIHDGIPKDYYRGKIKTDENGYFQVKTTVPVPYQIPHSGPVGAMMDMMGRHTWRPAHVHVKIREDGYRELITQLYFEGDPYVGSDCCEGIVPPEFVFPRRVEDGKRIIETTLKIEPLAEVPEAA